MPAPADFLQPGETLLFSDDELRDRSGWISLIAITLPPFIYLAGWAFAPSIFGEPWNVAIAAGAYLLWLIAPEIFLTAGWLGRWRIAVTDARILFRPGFLGLGCKGIALPKGRLVKHEWRARRLLLVFDDETLALRYDKTAGERVVEAVAKACGE